MNDLRPITLEFIKELRGQGKWQEAENLLMAYHQSRIKGRIEVMRDIRRHDYIRERAAKAHLGDVCMKFSCNNPRPPNHKLCERCRAYSRDKKR